MRQSRVQYRAADIVEVEIDSLGAGARDRGRQILLRLVVDHRVGVELARDEGAFLRPARDPHHAAAFDASDLYRHLPYSAGGGGDDHAITGSQVTDVTQSEKGSDGAQAERTDPVLDRAEAEIEFLQVTPRKGRMGLPTDPGLYQFAGTEIF